MSGRFKLHDGVLAGLPWWRSLAIGDIAEWLQNASDGFRS